MKSRPGKDASASAWSSIRRAKCCTAKSDSHPAQASLDSQILKTAHRRAIDFPAQCEARDLDVGAEPQLRAFHLIGRRPCAIEICSGQEAKSQDKIVNQIAQRVGARRNPFPLFKVTKIESVQHHSCRNQFIGSYDQWLDDRKSLIRIQ